MFKKILIIIIVLAVIGGGLYYWFFYKQNDTTSPVVNTDGTPAQGGFTPINRSDFGNNTNGSNQNTNSTSTEENNVVTETPFELPKLRKLSSTPISGIAASSTASSSIVRYTDRGTGHVFEASDKTSVITKISNTTMPKIYESYWNRNATAAVLRYLKEDTDIISNFYAELRSTGSSTSETPYELKGKFLSPNINNVAISPTGNQVFTWNIEGGKGVGYISNFNEDKKTKIIDLPLTQVNIDWPEANTVTLTTKASGNSTGFMYSIDTKTGVMKKILGNNRGFTGKMSRDASQVLYSTNNNGGMITSLLNTKDNTSQELVFRTLSDKCVWSNLRKNEFYCAVPSEIPSAIYPDDWYKGNVLFTDQIWYVDTSTGEVHLMANLLGLADELIDATNLTLDPKDNFLYFINKRDLSLWALDLNQ